MIIKFVADEKDYIPYEYNSEQELEDMVKEHHKEIFGQNSIWFDKVKLKSLSGVGSIPDGFVIEPRNKKFYVIEIELEKHPIYEHIVSQLSKFNSGISNYNEIKKLTSVIYEVVKENSIIKNEIVRLIGDEEIHKLLLDIISKPELIVIIANKTNEVEEACSSLSKKPKIMEFKTYIRKDVGDLRVHAHLFDSLVEEPATTPVIEVKPLIKEIPEKKPRARKGEITSQKDYFIPILESLIEFGGSGKMKEVLNKVEKKMKGILKEIDYQQIRSVFIRWKNIAQWARNTMKEEGLLKKNSPHGIWEITDKGRRYFLSLKGKKSLWKNN